VAVIPPDWTTNGNDKWARETYAECLAAEGGLGKQFHSSKRPINTILHTREEPTLTYGKYAANWANAYDRLGRTSEARALLRAARDESVAEDGSSSPWALRMRERWGQFLLDHSHAGDPDFTAAELELKPF